MPTAAPLGALRPVAPAWQLWQGGTATAYVDAELDEGTPPGASGALLPVARAGDRRARAACAPGRAAVAASFELGSYTPPPGGTPYGDTDPDAATLVLFAPGVAPPPLAASDPDAARLVRFAAPPPSLALSDPDAATLVIAIT